MFRNKNSAQKILKSFFSLLFIGWAAFCSAQVQISASVDKKIVDIAQDISLVITISAPTTDISAPVMPSLPNFNIYSAGQSQNVDIINNVMNTTAKYYFILSPRFPGNSTIGSFSIDVDKKTYKTDPIEVEVSRSGSGNAKTSLEKEKDKGSGRRKAEPSIMVVDDDLTETAAAKRARGKAAYSQKKPDFFMTASVDKTSAYEGEQALLRIRFYQSQNTLGNPQYERPKMEGLISEDVKTTQDFEIIDGQQYIYAEFVLALFGVIPGEAHIGSAKIDYTVGDIRGDLFDIFLSKGGIAKTVKSEPIDLEIKPLPQDAQARDKFFGAVGTDYGIKAEVDNLTPQAGEPFVLKVTVHGKGNMRAIKDNLKLPELDKSFRVYETTTSSSSKINGVTVEGSKEYQTVIVPRASGSYTIPPIDFDYFDTNTYSYRQIRTQPLTLNVKAASSSQNAKTINYAEVGEGSSPRVERVTQDIEYLRFGAQSDFSALLCKIADFGRWNLLVFVLVLAGLFAKLASREDIAFLAKKKAFAAARRALQKAKTLQEVSCALNNFVESKLGASIGLMTIAEVASKLKLTPETSKDLENLMKDFDILKYAPASSLKDTVAVNDAAQKTLVIIRQIDREAK